MLTSWTTVINLGGSVRVSHHNTDGDEGVTYSHEIVMERAETSTTTDRVNTGAPERRLSVDDCLSERPP